jgi:ribose transport system substrate-binding protein
MKKRLTIVALLLLVGMGIAFAQGTEEESTGKVFGYITPGPDTWYQRNVEGFEMGAEKDGNKVIVLNSDYDVSKEVSNIDSMINQGVDALCIFSFNENGAKIAAEKCAKAGIPMVATDSCGTVLDAKADVVAAVDFDWIEMGNSYAEWMAENHPGENFVIITGNFESVPCQLINKAMTEKAAALGKNKLIDIREGEYNPSVAANVAQDLVASGKDFSVIFVMNEDMAAAVIRTLQSSGELDNYTVIAQNGSPAGLPLIKAGTLDYTISSSPGWEGLVSYLVLNQYVTGMSTEMNQQVMLPIMPVNSENIDDISKVVPWEINDIYWELNKSYFPNL